MEKIGHKETRWLLFCIMFSNLCLEGLSFVLKAFGTLSPLYIGIVGVAAAVIVFLTFHFIKGCNFETVFSVVWGRAGLKIFLIIMFAISLVSCMYRMRAFSIAIGDKMLLNTPYTFILLVMGLAVFTVALLKYEAISRYSVAAVIIFFLLMCFVVASALAKGNVHNLITKPGSAHAFKGYKLIYMYSDIVYLIILSCFVSSPGKVKAIAVKSLVTFTVVNVLMCLLYMYVVPYPASIEYSYPLHRLSLVANSSALFQRLDVLIYVIWIFEGFISSGAIALFAVSFFKRTFSLKSHNALCFSITLICFLGALLFGDILEYAYAFQSIYAFVLMPVTAVLYKWRVKKCTEK